VRKPPPPACTYVTPDRLAQMRAYQRLRYARPAFRAIKLAAKRERWRRREAWTDDSRETQETESPREAR